MKGLSMSGGGKEKRRDFRRGAGFPLVVEDAEAAMVDYVENISCSGVLCRAVQDVPIMTRLRLVFDLPGPDPRRLECEGVVVRREEGGGNLRVGVVFTNLSAENRTAIAGFAREDLA